MATSEWEATKEIFAAALALPPAGREAYVEAACAGRAEVACAVRELLRAHEEASTSFLEPGSIALRAAWIFRPGDRIADRFRIVRPIARGAMGEVYEVFDERLRLGVALKAIRPELLADPDTVERFRREVLVTRDIAYDGICRVFDLVEHPLRAEDGFTEGSTLPCLTMQLLQGTSLEEWMASRRPLAISDALPLVRQIADALETLHEAGIVHRDLKPSNVVIVEHGSAWRAVLTDFGLARPIERGVFETQAGAHGGAPFYMAPELFRGERPSPASDIYALGLIVDELVTERRAFSATSLHGLLLQKLGDGPEPASRRARNLPRAWDRAIARCLDADPSRRPSHARDLVAALSEGDRWHRWRPPRWRAGRGRRRWWRAAQVSTIAIMLAVDSASWDTPLQTIAIAGFVNRTGDQSLEYLAGGTAGELGRRLARVREFQVISQPDAAQLRDAGRQPDYTLGGEVRRTHDLLQFTVHITDTASGARVWSHASSGVLDHPLQIEERLANATVSALYELRRRGTRSPLDFVTRLLGEEPSNERPRAPAAGTTNSAAFDAYLRGRVLFEERTLGSALQAISYLRQAIALDDRFAAAYATLADVNGVLMDLHYAPHDRLVAEADEYAGRAVELDPTLAEGHLSLAAVRQMQWRWAEAEAAYKRAIELHPTSARAHRWYGGLVLQFGRFDEALALYRRAVELDPFDYPSQSAVGHALFNANRPLEAAAHLERLVSRRDMYYAHALLGQVYAYLIRAESKQRRHYLRLALAEAARLDAQEHDGSAGAPPGGYADLVAAMAWTYAGDFAAAQPYVDRLEAGRREGRVVPGLLARVFAARADSARTLAALLDAEMERDRELLYVNVSPIYQTVRDHPEFQALVERLHLSRR